MDPCFTITFPYRIVKIWNVHNPVFWNYEDYEIPAPPLSYLAHEKTLETMKNLFHINYGNQMTRLWIHNSFPKHG